MQMEKEDGKPAYFLHLYNCVACGVWRHGIRSTYCVTLGKSLDSASVFPFVNDLPH